MGDNSGETYEEVKAAVEPEEPEEPEAPEAPKEPEEAEEPPKPKAKPKAKPKEEESKRVAKPGKNDKVECAGCGKQMNANTLRYKHVCKPPKGDEIQKEKPRKTRPPPEDKEPRRKREAYSPSTPRTKMLHYYREARLAQQEQKQARYRSWLGND